MTIKNIDELIIKDRGTFYDCSRETFFKPGTTFRTPDFLNGKEIFYHTRLFDHIFISAGKEFIPLLSEWSDMGGRSLELDDIREKLKKMDIEDSYPHYTYSHETVPSHTIPPDYNIRDIDPSDHPTIQAFLATCSDEDIEDALIDVDDPDEEIRMVFQNDAPVGYAGYRLWESGLGDVGILIHPDHRKMGLGIAAVAATTAACIANGRLPFYRTSRDNKGSAAIAEGLGYKLCWISNAYNYKI